MNDCTEPHHVMSDEAYRDDCAKRAMAIFAPPWCEVCDPETREKALVRNDGLARRLNQLAGEYRALGMQFPPHGDAAKRMADHARSIIRELVEDWL